MKKTEHWESRKLAAQCIIPRIDIEKFHQISEYKDEIIKLTESGIGGFCIFGGNCDFVEKATSYLQSLAEIPLIFAADFENGLSMRLEDGTAFPHAMALGIANDAKLTEEIATAIAKEAKDIGVHWNLAPVCDINSNPRNPIINIRSFGPTSEIVSKHILAYIKGTQAENVAATAKHFPGHGNTTIDSHIELPIIDCSLSELYENEIIPFRAAIEGNVKSIMVGHLLVKSIDESKPASLSEKVIKLHIREKLGFDGLVLTDALDMKSVSQKYSPGELLLLALSAGNDILLMPENPIDAISIVEQAIEKSEELREQVISSVRKILSLKRFCGLIPSFAKNETKLNTWMKHTNLALRVAIKSIKSDIAESDLPIDSSKQYAAFSIIQNDYDMQAASRFFTMLAQATENDCDYGYLDTNISDEDTQKLVENIENAEFLIFAIFSKGRAYQGSIEISDKINNIIEKISNGRKKYVIIFGYPHFAKELECGNIIYCYSDSFPSIAAAIMKLTGRELPENY
ncbi:MAG: glycoside hydrolase family 3 protein [Bacteroidota bacterium]